MAVEVRLIPCLSDNYAVLLHEPETKTTALVDAPEAAPILAALEKEGWKLTQILITHHHPDHVQGIREIRAKYPVPVYGPRAETRRVRVHEQHDGLRHARRFGVRRAHPRAHPVCSAKTLR